MKTFDYKYLILSFSIVLLVGSAIILFQQQHNMLLGLTLLVAGIVGMYVAHYHKSKEGFEYLIPKPVPSTNKNLVRDYEKDIPPQKQLTLAKIPGQNVLGKNFTAKVGPPNPKTLFEPIIPPPSHNLDYWNANVTHTHSNINSQYAMVDVSQLDARDESETLDGARYTLGEKKLNRGHIKESFSMPRVIPSRINPHIELAQTDETIYGLNQNPLGSLPLQDQPLEYPSYYYSAEYENNDTGIDDQYYYDPNQLAPTIALPSNLAASDYEKQPEFGDYNANIFTQTIQPNIYTRSEVIEPINANLGISYMPQFTPVDTAVGGDDSNGNYVTFTRIDPQLVRDDVHPIKQFEDPVRNRWSAKPSQWETKGGITPRPDEDEDNFYPEDIYDPRFSGYGDGTRSYVDMQLGNVQYYYSDIDAYRKPNFIIRSNVDHMDHQLSMGPVEPEYHRQVIQENYRDIAENQFMRDTLFHREDIMERLMRKDNARRWQLRAYPIRSGLTYSNIPKM